MEAQQWLEENYPKKGTCLRKKWVRNSEKEVSKEKKHSDYGKTRTQITELDIRGQYLEGQLDLSDFPNLERLNCENNKLTSLNISNCSKLKRLTCFKNHLTQDLSIFSQFKNLEKLEIGNNTFFGSLEPLKDLTKLEELDISNTNIDHGLEFLPRSVEKLDCSFDRPEARVSDIYEELQPFGFSDTYRNCSDLKKWREVKLDKKLPLTISPLLPPQLIDKVKEGNKSRENYDVPNTKYDEIHFNLWKDKENKNLSSEKQLPTKLYNIQKKEVEETEKQSGNYAILSYVWGSKNTEISEEASKKYKSEIDNTSKGWSFFLFFKAENSDNIAKNSNKLNISGSKALYKAIQVCKLLGINHIWIDQLCINQNDPEEKAQEVSKMRQYYSNADYTLISINNEIGDLSSIDMIDILKAIVRSEWFTRSWTYQEGWLSKHTIFMFDDKLADGWAMAGTWALNQLKYSGEGGYNSRREFQKGTKKIATPVGWVYYRDGYDENDKVEMTLNQALKEVKKRGRSVPVDGIYSILGLLPYGEQAKVDYEANPQDALYEVMKVAVGYREKIEPTDYVLKKYYPNYETVKETLSDGRKVIEYFEYWDRMLNKYIEPIAWHGTSNTTPKLCWMPEVYEDGSTSVEGGMEIKGISISFGKEKYIRLDRITTCPIIEANSNLNKIEGGFEIESGLYQKVVKVKHRDKYSGETEIIEVSLLGTQETLNSAKVGKELVVFNKKEWQSNKPFALLVENTGKKGDDKIPICHRLGLVELGNEKLQVKGRYNDRIIIGNNSQELQAQIELPPKNNYYSMQN